MAKSKSEQMAGIRSRHTEPERALRSALWAKGLRYRLHAPTPAGRPDLVLPGPTAVFVDGCFWHGCPRHYSRPRTREDFWAEKLRANVERDRRQTRALRSLGWRVLRVWEHELAEDALVGVVDRVMAVVRGEAAAEDDADWRVVRVLAVGDAEERHLERFDDPTATMVVVGPRVSGRKVAD